MKKALRSIFCLLLVLSMLLATGCKKPASQADDTAAAAASNGAADTATEGTAGSAADNTPDKPAFVVPDDDFMPVVRFAVTGDLHLRNESEDMLSRSRLASVISSAYAYADAHPYNKLDGIFFTGDNTDDGTKTQQTDFFDYLKENVREGTFARAVMGNHEFYASGYYTDESFEKGPINFMTYSGYDSVDLHQVINGYHFIFLSMDRYNKANNMYFSEDKLNWLKTELDNAVADAPGQPVFLFQHEPPKDTMAGSSGGDKGLKELLSGYPQVVDFSGHTHMTMSNPRAIWQGSFTALTTASMAYLGIQFHAEDGSLIYAKATDEFGGYTEESVENAARSGGMYYMVEVDKDQKVRILIVNIFSNSIWGEPIVLDLSDPKKFTYTPDRQDSAVKPVFENAAITPITTNHKNMLISLPRAVCPDVVQAYQIKILQNGQTVKALYRLAGSNQGDAAPELLKFYLGELKPSTAYTVEVRAISSWGLYSDPLSAQITTDGKHDSLQADVLDILFNDDGTATDAITGEVLKINGTPTVTQDADLGKNVAAFDGTDDAYIYHGIASWYEQLQNGFTLDTYVYIDKKPISSTNIVSNFYGGGFGLEYHLTGKVIFNAKVNNIPAKPVATVAPGQWHRLTASFDGEAVSLYVDGQLAKRTEAEGVLDLPGLEAQFLCIGANSGIHNLVSFFDGSIASVRMFSRGLTAAEIAQLN